MLIRYGGLTQRESAEALGLGTGVAVSCQLKRLRSELDNASDVSDLVQRIENKLAKSPILYYKG